MTDNTAAWDFLPITPQPDLPGHGGMNQGETIKAGPHTHLLHARRCLEWKWRNDPRQRMAQRVGRTASSEWIISYPGPWLGSRPGQPPGARPNNRPDAIPAIQDRKPSTRITIYPAIAAQPCALPLFVEPAPRPPPASRRGRGQCWPWCGWFAPGDRKSVV